jgi:putative addiction module component (TIGR02574 family)
MAYDKKELFKLPVEEKYELVMDLWENIDEAFLGKVMSRQGFENEIDRRIERIEKDPEILIPWEEVLKKMKG